MARYPVLDISECNACEGCTEAYPDIFVYNDSLGFIEVVADDFNEDDVKEAIKNCPTDAISWEE